MRTMRKTKSKRRFSLGEEEGCLVAASKELVELARQWPTKWNRLSNGCRSDCEGRLTHESHSAVRQSEDVIEKVQDIHDWLEFCWELENEDKEYPGRSKRR